MTSIQTTAKHITDQLEAAYTDEAQDFSGVRWTGALYYCSDSGRTFYEFITPDSWDGRTWYDEDMQGSLDSHDVDTLRGIVH